MGARLLLVIAPVVNNRVDPWRWRAHPTVWLVMGLLAVGYALMLSRVGPRYVEGSEPVATNRQIASFTTGVAVLWLFSDWPIHDLAERYLYSVHMVQHLAFTLVAPPLLLLGLPGWSVRWLAHSRALHWMLTRLARPIPAAVIYNCAFAFTHIPAVVDTTVRSEGLHFLTHVLLVVTALNMWFPVVNRLPEFPRLGNPARMVYLFAQSILPTVPVAFLALSSGVVYKFYATVPRPFPISAIDDQQLAAAIMKIVGGLIIWGVIVVMFFRWYAETQNDEKVLTWEDVEKELEHAPSAPPEL